MTTARISIVTGTALVSNCRVTSGEAGTRTVTELMGSGRAGSW